MSTLPIKAEKILNPAELAGLVLEAIEVTDAPFNEMEEIVRPDTEDIQHCPFCGEVLFQSEVDGHIVYNCTCVNFQDILGKDVPLFVLDTFDYDDLFDTIFAE